MYRSTKTYGHEVGLSCAFRQWRAQSHCRLVHGYAVSVKLEFSATELDDNNWVMDFGALKDVKEWLQQGFDHSLVVAKDDPFLEKFMELHNMGLARVVTISDVGCEKFAEHIYDKVKDWLYTMRHSPRVHLESVEVREHGANSAIYSQPRN